VLSDRRAAYDYLILATGARHSYFGHDEWEASAPGLKSLEDAIELRKRILLSFERAELEPDPAERARLLTFIVIGAGPTGVEMAGAIAELARKALAKDFRNINPESARIVLIEGGPRVLSSFPPNLAAKAQASLNGLGVEVMLGAMVTRCDEGGVSLGAERIESRCIIWAAGVASSPAAKWLSVEADRSGRAIVRPDLTIAGHPEIFVIGDCASVAGADGKPLPGLAPVAKQQGAYAARAIVRAMGGARPDAAFAYKDFGALATIGRKSAIADFKIFQLSGFLGWLVWCLAHIYFLIGFRNRLAVAADWTWSYLTFERGSRLITGPVAASAPDKTSEPSKAA
jgi:NADH dehydrogenase